MQEKFCLSPWKVNCYGDDHIQFNLREIKNKIKVNSEFISARQTKIIRRPPRFDKQKNHVNTRIETSRKQNSYRLQSSKIIHRSAQITPCKKQPLKLSTITNCKNLNLFSFKNNSSQLTRDSHSILLQRLLKLKKQGKLNCKESIGQRILRF